MTRHPHDAEFERDFRIPAKEPVPIDPDAPRYVIEEIEIEEDGDRADTRRPGSVMLFLAVAFAIVVVGYLLF